MQIEALIANRIDVSFARGPVDEPTLNVQTVLDEALVAALPSDHPLRTMAQLGIGMLAREPFVATARAGQGTMITLFRSAVAPASFRAYCRKGRISTY